MKDKEDGKDNDLFFPQCPDIKTSSRTEIRCVFWSNREAFRSTYTLLTWVNPGVEQEGPTHGRPAEECSFNGF